jgi:hypothetical protein
MAAAAMGSASQWTKSVLTMNYRHLPFNSQWTQLLSKKKGKQRELHAMSAMVRTSAPTTNSATNARSVIHSWRGSRFAHLPPRTTAP